MYLIILGASILFAIIAINRIVTIGVDKKALSISLFISAMILMFLIREATVFKMIVSFALVPVACYLIVAIVLQVIEENS